MSALLLGVGLAATACSSSSTSPRATTRTTTHVPATSQKPSAPASTADNVVSTGTATVAGKPTTVLTNSQGYTLYYFTPDTPTQAVCTTAAKTPTGAPCTTIWPPLELASGTPRTAASLHGALTTASDGNGSQVEYQGHPLYRYFGDSAPGQANGEGILGKWYAATPSLTSAAGSNPPASSSSTSTTGSGGHGAY
jgi:predicted lipoprotein with Yx(FWY)xxD motif